MKRIFTLILALLLLTGCAEKPDPAWQEEFDKGQSYYAEQNYKNAIEAYQKAIELDPQSIDTYLALADCYEKWEDTL